MTRQLYIVNSNVPWLCSCRVALAIISCLGFACVYALKVNMSVALVCMLNYTALQEQEIANTNTTLEASPNCTYYLTDNTYENNSSIPLSCLLNVSSTTPAGGEDVCAQAAPGSGKASHADGDFVWDKNVQGLILGAFFWGYTVTQVPGGWLAARFGGKRILGWCVFACAACTLLTPISAKLHYIILLILRFIVGVCQGVTWPAMHALWAYWAPPEERSQLIGFTFAGCQIGNIITFPFAALLCEYGFSGGWPSIFYVIGGLGMVWFVCWMFIVRDSPEEHPRISEAEKDYIQKSLSGAMKKNVSDKWAVPWKALLTSGPVYATIAAHTAGNWTTFTFLTTMPTYMKEVLQFDIKSNGFLSAVPYIGMWCFIVISGIIADTLIRRKILSVTAVRKLFNTIGLMVPSVLVVILGFLDCTQKYLAVALLTITIAFTGCPYSAGYVVNPADIAPKYASLLFGISNTFAAMPGFLGPFTVGILTPNQLRSEWQNVFYVMAAVATFGCITYLILGSGELQDWAREPKDVDNKDGEEKAEERVHLSAPDKIEMEVAKPPEYKDTLLATSNA